MAVLKDTIINGNLSVSGDIEVTGGGLLIV